MEKYNVLTGLVHTYCKPYRTNSYWKAVIALVYRQIKFGRGYITISDYPKQPKRIANSKYNTKINVFVLSGLLIEMLVIGFLIGAILSKHKII